MRLSKILTLVPMCLLTIGLLTGCEDVQIFQTKTDPYKLVALKDSELKNDTYYVKNNEDYNAIYFTYLDYVFSTTETPIDNEQYYLLLDEIQNLDDFVRVLNGLLRHENYDVYVTGSNSKFLSSEVDTEFGGRGDRIHLLPLTFTEFLTGTNLDEYTGLKMYERYGGIPLVQLQKNDSGKAKQATSILNETYIKDVKDIKRC